MGQSPGSDVTYIDSARKVERSRSECCGISDIGWGNGAVANGTITRIGCECVRMGSIQHIAPSPGGARRYEGGVRAGMFRIARKESVQRSDSGRRLGDPEDTGGEVFIGKRGWVRCRGFWDGVVACVVVWGDI